MHYTDQYQFIGNVLVNIGYLLLYAYFLYDYLCHHLMLANNLITMQSLANNEYPFFMPLYFYNFILFLYNSL